MKGHLKMSTSWRESRQNRRCHRRNQSNCALASGASHDETPICLGLHNVCACVRPSGSFCSRFPHAKGAADLLLLPLSFSRARRTGTYAQRCCVRAGRLDGEATQRERDGGEVWRKIIFATSIRQPAHTDHQDPLTKSHIEAS